MSHILKLFYDESSTDCRVVKLSDASQWDTSIPITNVVLKVEIPGFNTAYLPPFSIRRENYYTSNTFGISNATCTDGLYNLPDGIYKFTLSACPNEDLYTTEYVLRDCCIRNKILKNYSKYAIKDCSEDPFNCFGEPNKVQLLQDYRDLLDLLDMAKADVSIHKFSKAQEKLTYITRKLM